MKLAKPSKHTLPSFLLPSLIRPTPRLLLHHHRPCTHHRTHSTHPQQIPQPTPFVPNPSTFLTLIGRNLSAHASKFTSWSALFSLTSPQLRSLGVEPARQRRYLLWWRERFRKGIFGVGGDLTAVDGEKGVAYLRVVEVARRGGGDGEGRVGPNAVRKVIVNAPLDKEIREEEARRAKPIQGVKVQGAHTIVGPYVEPVKGTGGSVATIKVQEGMWEERRGQKVDGGERRKVQVRRKRKLEEMKKSRA